MSEMKIESDRGAANAKTSDENLFDEIFRRGGGKLGVEFHDNGAVESRRRQQPHFVALAGELEQGVLGPQE